MFKGKKTKPIPNFNPHEVAFNVEAIRGYFHTVAQQVEEGLIEQDVAHADAAILTGALEFAAQLWAQVSFRAGVPRQKARETFESEAKTFFRKHMDIEARNAGLPLPEGRGEA